MTVRAGGDENALITLAPGRGQILCGSGSMCTMSADAQSPVPSRRRRNKRRNILLIFLVLVLVVALAGAVSVLYLGNLARGFDSQTQTIPQAFPQETLRPVKPTQGPAAKALNVLLLGSDSRGDSLNLAEEGAPPTSVRTP